ncbi:MAG: DUF5777 family beta-barrel protein [Gemmatimonadota bacterium]
MKRFVRMGLPAVMVAMELAALASHAEAQARRRWQRRTAPVAVPVTVFHSTQAANLPTAEMLEGGEWLFEISHRFLPAISEGAQALWGFDGTAYIRLGLAWAPTSRLMVGVQRTNLNDNLELNAKARLAEGRSGELSWMVGAMGGIAWNTDPPQVAGVSDNETQAYGQLILDAGLGRSFAVGVVPTVLRNPRLEDTSADNAFVLGLHAQAYLAEAFSLLAEWIVSDSRPDQEHDAFTAGVELETGGHFFKIVVTNQMRPNPTQTLGGSPFPVALDELRVGFNITRLLAF